MDLSIYLSPIELPEYNIDGNSNEKRIGDFVKIHTTEYGFPDLDSVHIAIFGVNESRLSINNHGTSKAADAVRKYFYRLYPVSSKIKVVDLGNINAGHDIEDTYFAVKTVAETLMKRKIVPIIIGGSQDITYANYLAYENMGQIINITSVDSSFDLGNAEENFNSRSYLSKIILHQPNFLFNFTNIGYQTYFVNQDAVQLMRNLYFDVYRLGQIRNNMEDVEPLVRNADMLSFDISSIRQAEAPANANASPNGFDGEEACKIARYAGLSDKLTSFGLYEINPDLDQNGHTAHLAAHIIWYFIDGYYQRKGDFPHKQKKDYLKYIVGMEDNEHEIVFYKSKRSGRWWMQVPLNNPMQGKYERHFMVPCSFKDYETANNNEIPDRWWQVYQKLM
jgi:arginase family enzyme